MQKRIKQAQKYLEWEKPDQAIAELKPTLNSKQIQREFKWVPNHLMGIALSLKGEHKVSAGYLEKAVQHGSVQPETYHMLSVNYYHLGQFEKAEKHGKEAVDRKEDFLKAWLHLGSVHRSQAKLDEALECYKKANQIDPTNAGVAFRIGEIYRDQGDLDQAMKLFDITLKIEENNIRAMLEKADIYKKKGNLKEALKNLDQARGVHGDRITIEVSEAEIYKSQGDYDKAINLYESLLEKEPKSWALRVNYALCLQEVSRFNESEKHYRQAIEDMEGSREALSNYLMGLHYNPHNSKEYIYNEHVRLGKKFIPENPSGRAVPSDTTKDKQLKVGFISGGFRRHPVGWMIAGALDQLRDDEYELYCYTTNNKFDFITRRIHQNIDAWRSVVGYSSDVIENLIREDELDILVDLSGHASDNCMDVMANEPAPVMVKWVGGLFNTTGLEAFDYLITDRYESPEGDEQFYTEKLVRMPDDYITYTPPAYAPDVEGLPAKRNGYITFGCFNNPTKVNEQVLYHWARIMREVPESQLYLKSKQYDTASFRDQIVQIMKEEDIAEERILFEGHTAHDEHLEAYNKVDIALDPWPYSGGLTTCEALYMGVPVITMPGPTFAGRHSTTHLMNAGLDQWVTSDWEEYTNKVVALASNLDGLEAWRLELRDQLINSPVCDGKRFGAHLSKAFREMWKQRVKGYQNNVEEWQEHIIVNPLSDAQVQQLTDGPITTPFITTKDSGDTKDYNRAENKDLQNKSTESMIDTEDLVQNVAQNGNGQSKKNGANGFHSKSSDKDDTYFVETNDGVTICTPADLDVLTTYVMLEQEEWFEPELYFARQFVQAGMHVVDVGAGFGAYSLPMAKQVGSEGRVSAFEPISDTRSYLEKSKIENRLNQLEVYVHGLAEETKRAAVKRAETPELHTLTEGEEIPLSTLDKWWSFIGQPDIDLVKIDVNGMESQVLEGGQILFNKISPVVIASIGEEAGSLQKLQDQFKEIDYKLYEYIPGPGLLAEHDPEAGVDSYLINLVGVPQSRIEEFKESGWIFDDGVEVEAADLRGWESILGEMPWTESQLDNWKQNIDAGNHDEYLKALNLICAAEQIDIKESTDNKLRSRKGAMMLQAVQILIGLFNSGKAGLSAALTYVRVMSQLGKRSQAVEMMKQLMETVNSGKEVSVELPFLPPLQEQDDTDIQTGFSKWLTVRIVEGWITLKNPTMYMADEQGQKMLEALEGNPEVSSMIKQVIKLSGNSGSKIAPAETNLNQSFGNKEENKRTSVGRIHMNGQSSKSGTLKHLYLGYPGKQGGAHGIHEIMGNKLAEEIERQGIQTSIVSASSPDFIKKIVHASENPGHIFYSGVMGYDLCAHADMNVSGNLFDLLDVPVLGFLGDHPYTNFMWNRMQKCAERTTFITPTPSVKKEFQEIFGKSNHVESVKFVPPPSVKTNWPESDILLEDRPIDLLIPWGLHKFLGSQNSLEEQLKALGGSAPKIGQKLYRVGLREYEKSLYDVFHKATNEEFGSGYKFHSPKTKDDEKWLRVLSLVDWTIRKDRRLNMLKTLSDVPAEFNITITAHPKVASFIPSLQDKANINWIGEVSISQLDVLYGKSKVVLNCNPTYPDTIHGRIRSGMAHGCYVISDYNAVLDKIFGQEDAIGLIRDNQQLNNSLAEGWYSLQEKANRGREIIHSRFTEEAMAKRIIEVAKKAVSEF